MSTTNQIGVKADLTNIRAEFPILHQQVNGKPLIYFDNAASNQKPLSVIEALDNYYKKDHANIHRGIHTLAERATEGYEATRKIAARFINAAEPEEIIFTKGTTEGVNLVAATFGRRFLNPGDEIIITNMEHHSNIVPWQMLCEEKDLVLKVLPLRENGEVKVGVAGHYVNSKNQNSFNSSCVKFPGYHKPHCRYL